MLKVQHVAGNAEAASRDRLFEVAWISAGRDKTSDDRAPGHRAEICDRDAALCEDVEHARVHERGAITAAGQSQSDSQVLVLLPGLDLHAPARHGRGFK